MLYKSTIIISVIFIGLIMIDLIKFSDRHKGKNAKDRVYEHQLRSLKDQYIQALILLIACTLSYVLDITIKANIELIRYMSMLYFPPMMYLFSEIKHISKKDFIGSLIDSEGVLHYIKIASIGLIGMILLFIRFNNLFNLIEIVIITTISVIIFLLNMADLCQKDNDYNHDNVRIIISSYICVVPNVISAIRNREVLNARMKILKTNLSNIKLGIKECLELISINK